MDRTAAGSGREPSDYELQAWADLQLLRDRPASRAVRAVGDKMADSFAAFERRASKFTDDHPKMKATIERGQTVVVDGARWTREAVPEAFNDWGRTTVDSVQRMLNRASRVGLSPRGIVTKHQKQGHAVSKLADVRALDLAQVDQVRSWKLGLYPAAAALSGAGAGLVITGGQLVIVAGAGATAAPGSGAVMGAMAADLSAQLGIAARAVGHIGLLYGYDPEAPAEKLFALSVINAGTAMSSTAKAAAMADISKLTQALFRGAAWKMLDTSLVTQLTKQLATKFGVRLTKQGLGKVVPGVGIVAGAGLNYATLEAIVDTADASYRRRFLLEKYPQLQAQETAPNFSGDVPDERDEVISVVDAMAEAGGPDLRGTDPSDNEPAGPHDSDAAEEGCAEA